MNTKSAVVGATGIALAVACGGTHKLGDGNQASEGSGGADGGSVGGGGTVNQGGSYVAPGGSVGVAGDPSFGGDPGMGGGSYGAGGVAYGGNPSAGGVAYGGVAGAGSYGAGAYPGGSFGVGGQVGAGGVSGGAPPDPGPYAPSTPGILAGGVFDPDMIRSWVGYVENFAFASASDALSLTLSQTSPTELRGRVTVGQGSGALPDLHVEQPRTVLLSLVEGFAFTAMNGRIVGSRLVFDVAPAEASASVCSAQTPWPGYRSCSAGGWGADPTGRTCTVNINGQESTVDCGVLYACTYVCRCDDTSCFADTSAGLVHFDVTLREPYLDGSAAGLNVDADSALNVHFSPQ